MSANKEENTDAGAHQLKQDGNSASSLKDCAPVNDDKKPISQVSNERTKRNKTVESFPVVLHEVLSEVENYGLEHIISWQVHGRCFLVHREDDFVQHILQFWFKQTKFASFHRQLNTYGFRRIKMGVDKGAFYHELFLRGKSFLCHHMKRGETKSSRQGIDPDFYKMEFLPFQVPRNPLDLISSVSGDDPATQSQKMAVGNCAFISPSISNLPNQSAASLKTNYLKASTSTMQQQPIVTSSSICNFQQQDVGSNLCAINEYGNTPSVDQKSESLPIARKGSESSVESESSTCLLRTDVLNQENLLSDAQNILFSMFDPFPPKK